MQAARTAKPVADDLRSQAVARSLLKRGAIAYENAAGLICDVGAPKDPKRGGKVFSRRRQLAKAARSTTATYPA